MTKIKIITSRNAKSDGLIIVIDDAKMQTIFKNKEYKVCMGTFSVKDENGRYDHKKYTIADLMAFNLSLIGAKTRSIIWIEKYEIL